jgi:hypothetical protein
MSTSTNINITCISNDELEEKIGILMRQTNYDEETAEKILEKHNYDVPKCIKEYLGVPEKQPAKKMSVNQQIYSEIRKKLGHVELPIQS